MNDPFFDEDDDAFDDLYGNPRPSASSPAVKPKQRNTDAPTAQPVTSGGRLSDRSPAASSSVVSRSYARDRMGSSASTATDLAASGKRDERRKKHGKPRRKASQELFEVQWESDAKVAKCRLCTSDFSLVRRKHHCRHCGRVMCSDCSSFLFFELSHRKHRVCATCNNQLLAEQEAYDRETLAGKSQERDTNVFDDSSDDGRPSVAGATPASTSGDIYQANRRSTLTIARTPKHNGDDEKARKKLEKQERKERKKREKMEKKGKTPPVVNMERISRRQVEKEDNPSKKEAALFDGADDDWFTDAPDQNERSRDSGDEYTETGSKGPGWRDRVKDTYVISTAIDQPSVLPPMPGSRLTAGITGKGYISEQFQYNDVAGPGLGHDDDHSVAMPRPKQQQQSVSTAYADQDVKPSRLTGNGYFSEQFQYNDVAGPGLGHDDDHSVAMPRPKQQQQQSATTAYTDRDVKPSRLTGNGYFSEQFQYNDVAGPGLGHDDDHSVAMPRPKQQQQQSVSTAYADQDVKPSRLTGNGYFSEQFQYNDVAGPGLGHDDDHSVAMPRPKQQQQQSATTAYTDRDVKPSRLTGNGYFSEQFQYDDVAGPGLGHDDDHSVAMPRPKQQQQQSVSTAYADRSIKPTRLTGNGYFSEQFQYDDVGGRPGLGHDDDHVVAMPRPKQELAATSFSYDSVTPTQKSPEHNTPPDGAGASEPEFQPRLTFKDNLKDMFGTKRRESSAKKEKKVKASKPLARGNENMTLDELNPSYSSEDEPRMLTSAIPRTSIQPTFYENNAGNVVVDDSPGSFDASVAEREAQRKKEEEQQRQLASDMAWVNSSVVPPIVPAHRISSEQDSYSIVDHPSQASTSPVENRRVSSAGASTTGSNTNAKGGFTGALKRFFGMGSKTSEKATTPPKSAKVPPPAASAPSQNKSTETHPSDESENTHPDSNIPTDAVSNGFARHTVVNYYDANREEPTTQESFRNTVAAYADREGFHLAFETAVSSQIATQGIETTQQKPERKRRGTFDDLFESPKNDLTSSGAGRYSSVGANGWAARGGDSSNVDSAVGVARFDQRRSIDEADGFSLGDEPKLAHPPTRLSSNSTEAWRRSAAMSLLDDRKDATQSEGSAFTWSNVRSVPGLGTATYAVPTSLQPRAVYNDDRASSSQYDTPSAPLGSIMDDLKRSSTIRTSPATESVDDFFAEFEEPKDYVFDPATGGYVAARAPPRVEVSRIASRSVSTELQSPRTVSDKTVLKTNEREYHASSQPYEESTAHTMAENESEEVGDEVADIIVDKISSLEGELAALKQLIRNRKGSGGTTNQGYRPRVNHASARPSARKESIFDNDSSDEDSSKPSDPYASSIRPAPKREGKRRPGSKKKHIKKRKDSFADLFEDSPNEKETIGGAASYETLFQTGSVSKAASKDADSNSDDEMEPTSKPIKARTPKSRRRSSRKKIDFTGTKDDSESDPEFVSLKGHRGRQSLRRKTNEELDDTGVVDSSTKSGDQRTTPSAVDVLPVLDPLKRQTEEEDPLDALFDSSKDRDVTKLYGEDEDREKEDNISVLEHQASPLLKGKSVLLTPAYSPAGSDEEGSRKPSNVSRIVGSSGVNSSSYDPQTEDEEDDFSINWTKMRKTKSRRHKSSRNSSASTLPTDDNTPSGNATDDLLFEPNLLGEVTTVDVGKPAVPSAFLADASSNWMSVSTLEDDTVNLSLTVDESLESLLDTANDGESVELTVEMPVPDSHKSADTQDVASLDHGPGQELPASENVDNENSSENDDDPIDDVELSKQSSTTALLVSTIADSPNESDAAFDIFDKSGDVDFVPATSATSSIIDLTISGRADESAESENDDKVSLPDENEEFSFEIKAPKTRASGIDVSVADINAGKKTVPDRSESTPPSPTSSIDDDVELGKYTTSSVPSSRTPSVDGSIDDLEDAPLPDESVLGKIETQAFDTDWNQMQVKEKERKKRLQAKQRQAQRDKVLRKQGASSRSFNGGSAAGSSKSKPKKKKKKDKDDTTSSHHKKSGSSRKHRHREKQDGDSASTSEPPRSLTEL